MVGKSVTSVSALASDEGGVSSAKMEEEKVVNTIRLK